MTKEKILENFGLAMDFMDKLPEGAEVISVDIIDLYEDRNDVKIHLYGDFDFHKFAEMHRACITEKYLDDSENDVMLSADVCGCTVRHIVHCPEGQSQTE